MPAAISTTIAESTAAVDVHELRMLSRACRRVPFANLSTRDGA